MPMLNILAKEAFKDEVYFRLGAKLAFKFRSV